MKTRQRVPVPWRTVMNYWKDLEKIFVFVYNKTFRRLFTFRSKLLRPHLRHGLGATYYYFYYVEYALCELRPL